MSNYVKQEWEKESESQIKKEDWVDMCYTGKHNEF